MEKNDTIASIDVTTIFRIINSLVDLSGTPENISAIFGQALKFVLEVSRMEVGLGYILEDDQSYLVASTNLRPDNLHKAKQLKVKNLVPLLDRDCAAVVTREYLVATRLSLNVLFGTEIQECVAVPVSSRSRAHGVLIAMGGSNSCINPEVEEILLLIGVTAGSAVSRLNAPDGEDFANRVTAVA
ncbi:MAG: hypothetical protein K6U74_20085, partial [Firmicutes bacterium]|nr:hypothetical protein [Bacillota bacterium]